MLTEPKAYQLLMKLAGLFVILPVLLLSGCAQTAIPTIELQATQPSRVISQKNYYSLRVGSIIAKQTPFESPAGDLADYLRQQMGQVRHERSGNRPISQGSDQPAKYVLFGDIHVTEDYPDAQVLVTFKIYPTAREVAEPVYAVSYSHRLGTCSGKLQTATQSEEVRRVLHSSADALLSKICPAEPNVRLQFARGRSSFDRQGRRQVQRDDYPAALESFRRAVDVKPRDHAALYNLGLMLEALGNYDRACDCYRRALRLGSDEIYRSAVSRVESKLNQN